MFHQGVRPAVNVGISVSRVGSAAQIKAMKQVAGSIKLNLAQYREMAAFAQFASDFDDSTKKLLSQGERLVELLKQDQYEPMDVEDEVIVIFVSSIPDLIKVPVKDVLEFSKKIVKIVHEEHEDIVLEIKEKAVLSDAIKDKIKGIVIRQIQKDY